LAGKAALVGNAKGAPVTIVIRRDEGEEAAHHGGAWKVAYADFVTAMMAFFLLMWLLNATTEEQRTGLADYFAPTNLFGRSVSGSGQPFGGKTPNDTGTSVSTDGVPQAIPGKPSPQADIEEDDTQTPAQRQPRMAAKDSAGDAADDAGPGQVDGRQVDGRRMELQAQPGANRQLLVKGGDYAAAGLTPPPTPPSADAAAAQGEAARAETMAQGDARRESSALARAGAALQEAIRRDPALQDAAGQLLIDSIPEGLRIQVVDAEQRPMFALGGATPTQRVRELMKQVVPVLAGLPNAISIAGHTDSLSFRGQAKGNWELSSDRAHATRRILVEAGLPEERIRSVTGNADRDLLVPADPLNPSNRRITLIVLRHAPATTPAGVTPAGMTPAGVMSPGVTP
jgi:chemotaxis protein MotB